MNWHMTSFVSCGTFGILVWIRCTRSPGPGYHLMSVIDLLLDLSECADDAHFKFDHANTAQVMHSRTFIAEWMTDSSFATLVNLSLRATSGSIWRTMRLSCSYTVRFSTNQPAASLSTLQCDVPPVQQRVYLTLSACTPSEQNSALLHHKSLTTS